MTSTALQSLPTFSAFTLPDGRRGGLCLEEKPRCVNEHYVQPGVMISVQGITTCVHRTGREPPPCNTSLHLTQFHVGGSAVIRGQGTRLWLVIELRGEQVRHLRSHPMTIVETLHYLNAALPGVYDDLIKNSYRELR